MTANAAPPPPIKVALVDDQQLVRAGFRMVIDSQPDLRVNFEFDDGENAIAGLANADVDVILMDIRMPRRDGLSATAQLTQAWSARTEPAAGTGTEPKPGPRIIVLTTFDLDEYVLDAISAGASGFLLKDTGPEEMLAAIRTVHRGDAVIAPSSTRRLLSHLVTTKRLDRANPQAQSALDCLTEREREVLTLMARGRSNGEISADLFVAEATVKTHVGRILSKLAARDRVQAVVIAYSAGLVQPGA